MLIHNQNLKNLKKKFEDSSMQDFQDYNFHRKRLKSGKFESARLKIFEKFTQVYLLSANSLEDRNF